MTIAVFANAMSYEQARREALFLTDKMAYELELNDLQNLAVHLKRYTVSEFTCRNHIRILQKLNTAVF